MSYTVISPFPTFMGLDGKPLEGGSIYIGTANLNPETNPITVYWDKALTQPAAQPIRTVAGYPARNGSPAEIFALQPAYSITVRNSAGALVYTTANTAPSGTKDTVVSAKDYGAVSDGSQGAAAGNQTAIQNAIDYLDSIGGGILDFGGAGDVYVIGGTWATYGTFTYADSTTIPFKRGLLRMRSNITFRGAGAKLKLADGFLDPGGLFYTAFWESDGQVQNVTFDGLELDGNIPNQTFTAYAANTPDNNMWIQGHAIAGGSLVGLVVKNCKIHDWWGHAVFGFPATDFSRTTDNFRLIDNDIYNNMQGGAQVSISRFYSIRNRYHGDGGWTALGPNIECGNGTEIARDIWSIGDIFDGTDGLSTTLATVKDWGGHSGLDSNSPAALAARIHKRRGLMLSGDYYSGTAYSGQRKRVHIVSPTLIQATLGGGGFDWIEATGIQQEITYEDSSAIWPPVGEPIFFTPASNYADAYQHLEIDAQMACDVDGSQVLLHGFRKVKADIRFKGGRGAGVRLESCGGEVKVIGENFGLATDRAYWAAIYPSNTDAENDALIGATSSAVVAFGNTGPLEVNVHAIESRSGTDRQMQFAAYMNVGADYPAMVRGSSTGALIGTLKNINSNALDLGIIDAAVRKLNIGLPVIASNGFEAHGAIEFISDSGDLNVNLRSPNSTDRKINFFTAAGLQFQLVQLSDGSAQFVMFDGGTFERVPISFSESGVLNIIGSWDNPLKTSTGAYLWTAATGVLRIKSSAPAFDGDGVAVGSQT